MHVGGETRQIRFLITLRCEGNLRATAEVATEARLPGKAASHNVERTVLETDTGGQVEHTKARERTRVKELGKMVP